MFLSMSYNLKSALIVHNYYSKWISEPIHIRHKKLDELIAQGILTKYDVEQWVLFNKLYY